jgi:NitT/TauT family transport system substrate-binding protein
VLESGVKASQINVIKMQNAGTGMLEDGMFATASWLKSPANQAIATKVIGATLAGWIYCRDHQAACVGFTLKAGPTLPKGHQTWMMNEINKLIWPNASGVGIMNTADFNRTASIAKEFGVIKKPASGAYRTDLAKAAVAGLKKQGLDVFGKSWKPLNVKVSPEGK